jgi:hypothetical protein
MNLQVIEYSNSSIALIGDTKEIKEQLKQLGGRFNPRLTCGAGWVFSKDKRPQIELLIKGESTPATGEAPRQSYKLSKEQENRIRAYLSDECKLNEYWVNSELKRAKYAAEIDEGLFVGIRPLKIRTEFYFPYNSAGDPDDYDNARAAARAATESPDYFYRDNLEPINDIIDGLKNTPENMVIYNPKISGLNKGAQGASCIFSLDFQKCDNYNNDAELLNWYNVDSLVYFEELDKYQQRQIIELHEYARDDYKKRLEAYIKRYGLEKISAHTYDLND